MKNFEDLNPEDQKAYKEKIGEIFDPLEKKGIGKKRVVKDKLVFATPANFKKLIIAINLAIKEEKKDQQSILINGQIVFFSFTALMSMFFLMNEPGTEQDEKLDEYIKELREKDSVNSK